MRALVLVALSLTALASAFAAPLAPKTAPALPDTPAGHTLHAWLTAFNSGDRAKAEAYAATYDPGKADQMIGFHRRTGGFDLVAIDKSERLHIEFRVKEHNSATTALGRLDVKDADPAPVISFGLRAIPPGMTAADLVIKVDAATRTRILDGIAARLTEYYVYPDSAKKMVEALRAHQKKGEYDAITDGEALAQLLTRHLQAVSHDLHLRVACVPRVLPKEDLPLDGPPLDAEMRAELAHENCGFEKVERLQPNIGYVKFNFFGDPAACGPTATAAMAFVANADALVFDLRDNGGGEPKMVAYLASYLFDARTHLNDIFSRKENKTTQYWTQPDVPGKKLAGKPVYVLTAKNTFSGAEEFTYDLKMLKRATIVGETTGGGAHPTVPCRVEDHFFVGVPFARAVNPISKTDWEGKGVEPDVKVPADRALEVATRLAVEQIGKLRQPAKK